MTTGSTTSEFASSPQGSLDSLLRRMKDGETDGVDELRALASESPVSLPVLGNLAWALANRGEHQEAIECYRRYLGIDPRNREVRWRIGDRLVNLGRLEEALQTYEQVLSDAPDCVDAKMGVRYVRYQLRSKKRETKPYVPTRKQPTELQKRNQELNETEYKHGRLKLRSLPPRLYLESTLKCNFYCQTCTKGYAPYYAEDLQKDIFDKVQREVMPTNIRISITGFGEPTMASNFDEMLRMAIENGSQVHFVTNASLLNYDRIEKLTRVPVAITISVDGATKETFETIRAGSNFDLILDKLGMIKKLRDIHLSNVFSHFSFNFVALRQNIQELPDVVRLAHRYGIDVVGVADYSFNDNEFDENSPRFDPDQANRSLEEAKAVAEELGVKLDAPPPYNPTPPFAPTSSLWNKIRKTRRLFPEPHRFPQKCSSPWTEPYIHTDGMVTPCCASGQYLGNLKRDSFGKVWNGWRYRLLRWRIHTTLPPLGCRRCFVAWGINGGNAGNAMAREGLVIKIVYSLSVRFGRLVPYFLRLAQRIRRTRSGNEPLLPSPNFYRGRPISERHQREVKN